MHCVCFHVNVQEYSLFLVNDIRKLSQLDGCYFSNFTNSMNANVSTSPFKHVFCLGKHFRFYVEAMKLEYDQQPSSQESFLIPLTRMHEFSCTFTSKRTQYHVRCSNAWYFDCTSVYFVFMLQQQQPTERVQFHLKGDGT